MSDQALEVAIKQLIETVVRLEPGETVSVTRAKPGEEHMLMIGWAVAKCR